MGRSYFLKILLVSAFVTLSFSQGFGRKLLETAKHEVGDFSYYQMEENAVKPREMIETMDYPDPEPNTNPKASLSPPPGAGN